MTRTETPLIALLKTLDLDLLLNDGGTTWTVDNLIAAVQTAGEEDGADYTIGETEDGRVTISRLDAEGFVQSPPAYVQERV